MADARFVSTPEPVAAREPAIARQASGDAVVRAVVASCLDQVLGNASTVVGGGASAEHVHQLRIGLRRLRTALKDLAALGPGIDPAWQAPLAQAFRELGQERDLHYLKTELLPRRADAGGPDMDFPPGRAAVLEPAAVVRNPAFQDVLQLLHGFALEEGLLIAGPTGADAKKALAIRFDKLHARLLRDGKGFLALTEPQQHRVRKRLKRLRYLAEFVAPLFSRRRVGAYVAALRPAQDALGQYHDELTGLHACEALAATDPRAWFGAGWLAARRPPNAKSSARALQALAKVRPFWN